MGDTMNNYIYVRKDDYKTKDNADAVADMLCGIFSDAFVEVASSFAMYNSDIIPSYNYLIDGKLPFDYLLRELALSGVRIHAWVDIGTPISYTNAAGFDHDWIIEYLPDVEWFDFSNPNARRFVIGMITEILGNYPVIEGIHLDYCRYPSSNQTRQALSLNIDDFIVEARQATRGYTLTAAVQRLSNFKAKNTKQNWPSWIGGGFIDKACAITYLDCDYIDKNHPSFAYAISDYVDIADYKNLVGITMRLSQDEIIRQIDLVSKIGFTPGIYHFSDLTDNVISIMRRLSDD